MVTGICIQANGLDDNNKPNALLPAMTLNGEAGLAASWLNKTFEEGARLNVKPLRKFCENGENLWYGWWELLQTPQDLLS